MAERVSGATSSRHPCRCRAAAAPAAVAAARAGRARAPFVAQSSTRLRGATDGGPARGAPRLPARTPRRPGMALRDAAAGPRCASMGHRDQPRGGACPALPACGRRSRRAPSQAWQSAPALPLASGAAGSGAAPSLPVYPEYRTAEPPRAVLARMRAGATAPPLPHAPQWFASLERRRFSTYVALLEAEGVGAAVRDRRPRTKSGREMLSSWV